ncbi:MAG: radical SAM protein [Candidatus Thorarchaeota archaeon]
MSFDILHDGPDIITATPQELAQYTDMAFSLRLKRFGRELYCYGPTSYPHNIPSHTQRNRHNFISLSVTGTACSLQCEHCKGRLLSGMEPVLTPEDMLRRLEQVKDSGGEGALISGGSDSAGHVPLRRFGEVLRTAKDSLGLTIVVHTGLVDVETAQVLADAGIDAAMFDVIGDEEVAREIYHLRNGSTQMERTLRILSDAGVPIVPHIMVGLYWGQLRGEIEALAMVSRYSPAAIVVIVLSPLRHTPMEGLPPPSPSAVGRVLTVARLGLPDRPLLLGCARPLGQHKIETDQLAVRAGVNGIAYISEEGVETARRAGLKAVFKDVCCSLAYRHMT